MWHPHPYMKVNAIHVNNVITKPQKDNLKQHVASTHEGKHHPCQQCDYKGTLKSNLK